MKDLKFTDLQRYETLILDLDGTLLDSMQVWNEVDEIFLGKRGFKVDKEYTDAVKSSSMIQSAEYTKRRYGLKESPEEIIAEWEETVGEEYKNNIRLKDGVKEFLLAAKEMGLKLTSATALNSRNAVNCLKNNGVYDLFENVTTLEDLGHEVNKNDPAIFYLAAEKAGTEPSKCLVFEDVYGAIEGAIKGGFDSVIVYDELSSKDYSKALDIATYSVRDWKTV